MKPPAFLLRQSIQTGSVFAIVILFLTLIGFPTAGAALLARLAGHPSQSGQIPAVSYLAAFWVLLALWNGASAAGAARKSGSSAQPPWLSGLLAGAFTGLVMGLFNFGLGTVYQNGADFRNYLSALSPPAVKYFLFDKTALTGSLYFLATLAVGGLAGGLLNQLAQLGGAPVKQSWNKLLSSGAVRFLRTNHWVNYVLFAVLVLVCFFVPRQWGSYWNYVFGMVGIYIVLGLGLNIIVGLSGQLVLGYVGFFAIGAYTMALLNSPFPHNLMWGFWIALVLGVLLAALSGVLIGLPLMRLRGDYLAIVTLGFGEIIRILLKSDLLTNFTGGPRGVQDIKGPVIFGTPFNTDVDFMYLTILAVLLAVFIASRLQYSRTGRAWISIREDATVATASGVSTTTYRLLALALGAALAGLGGGIFAAKTQFTGPGDHDLMVSINVLSIVIVGGAGSIPGAFIGAFALKGVPEILRELETYRLLAFGALLVAMMLLRPQGLWPVGKNQLEHKAKSIQEADEKAGREVKDG